MKDFLVPIKFERKVTVETTVRISAENAQEAHAQIQKLVDLNQKEQVFKKIDNTDAVYNQFADHAEVSLDGSEVENLVVHGEAYEE